MQCYFFARMLQAVQVSCVLAGGSSTEVYISGANVVYFGLKRSFFLTEPPVMLRWMYCGRFFSDSKWCLCPVFWLDGAASTTYMQAHFFTMPYTTFQWSLHRPIKCWMSSRRFCDVNAELLRLTFLYCQICHAAFCHFISLQLHGSAPQTSRIRFHRLTLTGTWKHDATNAAPCVFFKHTAIISTLMLLQRCSVPEKESALNTTHPLLDQKKELKKRVLQERPKTNYWLLGFLKVSVLGDD